MKVDELRERFLKFFEKRGHTIYPSDSLIPTNDPTLLFTGAGMNQFKEEFLGRLKGSKRRVTCQKCLRTGDLDKVGKTPDHHTFFEMLGNFSFGDYFKKEAILWAYEFLTEELGLKKSDLWVSVYKNDEKSCYIWDNVVKIPEKRIIKLGDKENFWPSNALKDGPNGPCGPCSEIFYGGRDGVEVWNLVFTQFDRKDGGELEELPNKNIDTGMGLERIARVMQGKATNFEIDLFVPIIDAIKNLLYSEKKDVSKINAIADHIRAVTFAVRDGVLPSNEERGYVVRKLIRKAFWYGRSFGIDKPFLYKLVPVVAKVMDRAYLELTEQREDISQVVKAEEKKFKDTIDSGIERLEQIKRKNVGARFISGEDAFMLYDTYGFPLELTKEIATSEGIKVDVKGFEICMGEQRVQSRKGSKIVKDIFKCIENPSDMVLSAFVEFLDKEMIPTEVLAIVKGDVLGGTDEVEEIGSGEKANVYFKDKTNFYGEKGGQVGDTGWLIKNDKIIADVTNTVDETTSCGNRSRHEVEIRKDSLERLKKGDKILAKVDISRREDIKKNHTATHLLHSALRKVLGLHVRQSGSLVAPDRLRFDFTHFKSLTDDEILRVEDVVNGYIKNNTCVKIEEMSLSKAKKMGVVALFGEKYGEEVRVIAIGEDSKELCGGTHVKETGEIKLFKIVSEMSIASGIRRIEAVTGRSLYKIIREKRDLINTIAEELGTLPDDIIGKINRLMGRIKKIEKEMDVINNRIIQSVVCSLLEDVQVINGYDIIIAEIKNGDIGFLRKTGDVIKLRLKKFIFVLGSEKDNKFSFVLGVCGDFKSYHKDAVGILDEIGTGFGIKGGGRHDFAQAGGKAAVDINRILKKAEEVIGGIVRSRI